MAADVLHLDTLRLEMFDELALEIQSTMVRPHNDLVHLRDCV